MTAVSKTPGPVRVSLPASVAADIGSLKKAMGSILDKLGCQACCSGHDIFIELQRDLVLRKDLKARAEVGVAPMMVRSAAFQKTRPAVRVGISPRVADSIDNVFLAIDRIAELSGHTACATGCDMFFNLELNYVLDAKLGIEEQALTLG
ncbi:MAG: hypothetical protein R2748_12770 [Bryobacterales bacterium]